MNFSKLSVQALCFSLLSCALYGLTPAVARAQDTAVTTDKTAPTAPVQVARAGQPPTPPAPTPAAAAAPAGPAPGSVTVTGLVDIYYEVNARAPHNAAGGPFTGVVTVGNGGGGVTPGVGAGLSLGDTINVDNAGRAFDINDREVSFSLGEVNIVRTANKSFPIGITATIVAGDTARLVAANEPGGTANYENVLQLYFSKTTHFWGRDFTFDFGKFVTPLGLEVIESSSNDNYTRSFGFNYAVPLYHAGLRVGVPITPKVSFLGAIVNGWNNVADDNNAKSVIAQLTIKPDAHFTGILSYMGGAEGAGAFGAGVPTNGAGDVTINLGEIQPVWQVTDKLKLSGDFVYARAAGPIGPPVSGLVSGSWLSMAGYAKYQVTHRFAVAARVEQFEDMPGPGGLAPHFGLYTKLREATITLEYLSFKDKLVSRLEYRHDHANIGFFGDGSGAGVKDQDTVVLGEVYKF